MRLHKLVVGALVVAAVVISFAWVGGTPAVADTYTTPPGQTPSGPHTDVGGVVISRDLGASGGNLAKTGSDILGMLTFGALLLLIGNTILLIAFNRDEQRLQNAQ